MFKLMMAIIALNSNDTMVLSYNTKFPTMAACMEYSKTYEADNLGIDGPLYKRIGPFEYKLECTPLEDFEQYKKGMTDQSGWGI